MPRRYWALNAPSFCALLSVSSLPTLFEVDVSFVACIRFGFSEYFRI
jgi:hypothetical protein